MSRCYGCFKEISTEGTTCPHCGFSPADYEVHKWTLSPGTVLNGKYLIGKRLGEGGFGITYIAWDINMQTTIAVKEYYPNGFANRDVTSLTGNTVISLSDKENDVYSEGLKRYVKEAAILSRFFDLSGIVTVKDFFYENSTAYIVMEYIDGISLKEYLKNNGSNIGCDAALDLLKPVISSLSIVHKNNLLHRDISPDNIMIAGNGDVKLIDFGAARQFGNDSDKSMTVVLKHGYAPVEQYSSHGDHGTWTDVYAICAVLYRCIVGKAPVESIDRTRNDRYVPVRKAKKGIPKHIAEAIDKGLSVNPQDRQQDMDELYKDLYGSFTGRLNDKVDAAGRALRKLLVALIIVLTLGIAVGVVYRLNSDRIRRTIDVFLSDDDTYDKDKNIKADASEDEDIDKEKEISSNTKSKAEDNDENEEALTERVSKSSAKSSIFSSLSAGNTDRDVFDETLSYLFDSSDMSNDIKDGIMVVSEGILDGYPDNVTLNDILCTYTDAPGEWGGYEGSGGSVSVCYRGFRNGKKYVIEFESYQDDTFILTGVTIDGIRQEAYSNCFQDILDEVGL